MYLILKRALISINKIKILCIEKGKKYLNIFCLNFSNNDLFTTNTRLITIIIDKNYTIDK